MHIYSKFHHSKDNWNKWINHTERLPSKSHKEWRWACLVSFILGVQHFHQIKLSSNQTFMIFVKFSLLQKCIVIKVKKNTIWTNINVWISQMVVIQTHTTGHFTIKWWYCRLTDVDYSNKEELLKTVRCIFCWLHCFYTCLLFFGSSYTSQNAVCVFCIQPVCSVKNKKRLCLF